MKIYQIFTQKTTFYVCNRLFKCSKKTLKFYPLAVFFSAVDSCRMTSVCAESTFFMERKQIIIYNFI